MRTVIFEKEQITLEVVPGTTILEAARQAGITVESPCNGAGTCGKCKLYREQISPYSALLIRQSTEDDSYVLACQACIQEDVRIRLDETGETDLKILSGGKGFQAVPDSAVKKVYDETADVTQVFLDGQYIAKEAGNTQNENYGIVVDIGTTTLVATLIDLYTGEELQSESALNPQALHAQDVLSRINLASEQGGLQLLYEGVRDAINELSEAVTKRGGVRKTGIYEVILSGNTCMIHLAANIDPEPLGRYPYIPPIRGGCYIPADEIGIRIASAGRIWFPPIISAFVGPDITSGVLSMQLSRQPGKTLFVDIGTNGEMVFANDGKLTATSTAAGPAFEGMNIAFGMRAAAGAIERFSIDTEGVVEIRTIGDEKAAGICGSGLMDIVGELAAAGVIKPNGKFAKKDKDQLPAPLLDRLEQRDKKTVFVLDEGVWLTQKDVRQVQLAKGAIRAGIEFLLRSQGITAAGVDRVMIAGSFGYHLRTSSLISLGLLPQEFADKVEYVGNTSKTGGVAFLLNPKHREEIIPLTEQIETIELANYEDFDKVFVKCMGF